VHDALDPTAASAAAPHSAAAAAGVMAGPSPGDGSLLAAAGRRLSSSNGSSTGGVGGSSGLPGSGSSEVGLVKGSTRSSSPQPQQQQQQLVMQLVDFGFVSTSATIGVRESGSSNKRLEKSWEHAVVSGPVQTLQGLGARGGAFMSKCRLGCVDQAQSCHAKGHYGRLLQLTQGAVTAECVLLTLLYCPALPHDYCPCPMCTALQVRYRASWGWPNYLDAQALGWDDGLFGRWLIDGQLHLSARMRVLG
jgi:hypothetical protein